MFGYDTFGARTVGDASSSVPATPTVSSVVVSPSTATVVGDATRQFTVLVSGTNSPPQTVTWSATGGSINSSGLFTAPAATTSVQTITITATSTFDGTKSGTATVTVPIKTATTLDLTFQDSSNVLKTGLTNLRWALFDQTDPSMLGSPSVKGSAASTNGSGVMTLNITGSTLITGAYGYLVVETSDGKFSFAGKVQVT